MYTIKLHSKIVLRAAARWLKMSSWHIYKGNAHSHRHGGSVGAFGTSQGGGGAGGGAAPQPRGGLGGWCLGL